MGVRLKATELELPGAVDQMSGQPFILLKGDLLALMFTQMITRFDQETDFRGEAWEPLGKAQERRRIGKIPPKRRKEGFKILQDDGTLRNSWTQQGAEGNETSIAGDGASLISNIEYVAVHNDGLTIDHPGTDKGFGKGIKIPAHKINMPKRQMDGFSSDDIDEVDELIDSHLGQGGFK